MQVSNTARQVTGLGHIYLKNYIFFENLVNSSKKMIIVLNFGIFFVNVVIFIDKIFDTIISKVVKIFEL